MYESQYTLIEQSTWIDNCEYTLIKHNKTVQISIINSLFLGTSLMLDKILSQDDKTGFAVHLYLVFKKHNWGIIGKNLEHCFKA